MSFRYAPNWNWVQILYSDGNLNGFFTLPELHSPQDKSFHAIS